MENTLLDEFKQGGPILKVGSPSLEPGCWIEPKEETQLSTRIIFFWHLNLDAI